MSQPMAPSRYPGISAGQLKACRWFTFLGTAYLLSMIIASFVIGAQRGHGTGFGDGRTLPSCATPGGPYYPEGATYEVDPCEAGSFVRGFAGGHD